MKAVAAAAAAAAGGNRISRCHLIPSHPLCAIRFLSIKFVIVAQKRSFSFMASEYASK